MRGGVPGQVHQHVDAVVHNHLAQRQVIQVRRLTPVVRTASGLARVLVNHGASLVDEHFEHGVVMAQ